MDLYAALKLADVWDDETAMLQWVDYCNLEEIATAKEIMEKYDAKSFEVLNILPYFRNDGEFFCMKFVIRKAVRKKDPGDPRWIPVSKAPPPSDAVNPITNDGYVYPVTVRLPSGETDVKYYTFRDGHWYFHSPKQMDEMVVAWMPRPEAYKG